MKINTLSGLLLAAAISLLNLNAADVDITYHVDQGHVSASDSNDGTSESLPLKTITAAVEKILNNDNSVDIIVKDGIYREPFDMPAGIPSKRIALKAASGHIPVISGSDVVTGWTWHSGSIYRTTLGYYTQMVFVDGEPLQQIGRFFYGGQSIGQNSPLVYPQKSNPSYTYTVADMEEGSFLFDSPNNTLYVWLEGGINPSGKLVEAGRRTYGPTLEDFNTVEGIAFQHYQMTSSSSGSKGAGGNADGVEVSYCIFYRNDGYGLALTGSSNIIENCIFAYNGQVGFTSSAGFKQDFINNTVNNNNFRGYTNGWHDGGVKVINQRECAYVGNTFHDEPTHGLWFDISCADILIADNTFDNCFVGIYYEISRWATIVNNTIIGSHRGIWSFSSDVLIAHNVLDQCNDGVIVTGGMRDAQMQYQPSGSVSNNLSSTRNNYVFNNIIIDAAQAYVGITINTDHNGHNFSDYNAFLRRPANTATVTFMRSWGEYIAGSYAWTTTTGHDSHSIFASATELGNPDAGDYSIDGGSALLTGGIVVPNSLDSVYFTGITPFTNTVNTNYTNVFYAGGYWSYRAQPEPRPLKMFDWLEAGSEPVGLNSSWSIISGYPGFTQVGSPVVNEFALDGITTSGNLLADGDFTEQVNSGTLLPPWYETHGLCFSWDDRGQIGLIDYATSGLMYHKVGAVTADTLYQLTLNAFVRSSLASVTTTGDIYFAVGPNLDPVGDLSTCHFVASPNQTIGWRPYKIDFQSGSATDPEVGLDLYVVVKGSIAGAGISYNGGAPNGQVIVDNLYLIKSNDDHILADGDLSQQPHTGTWQAPWVRAYGHAYPFLQEAFMNNFSYYTSGRMYQQLGPIKKNTKYEVRIDLDALSFFANVNTRGKAYLAKKSGSVFTPVGGIIDLFTGPISQLGMKTFVFHYVSGGEGDADIGAELSLVVDSSIDGTGVSPYEDTAKGRITFDNVSVRRYPLDSILVDGDFSAESNNQLLPPWYANTGNTSIYVYGHEGMVNLHDYRTNGWLYQYVGTVGTNTSYQAKLDMEVKSVLASVTTTARAYFAVGSYLTEVGNAVQIVAVPNDTEPWATYTPTYTSGNGSDPNVGGNLYIVIKGSIAGTGINYNGGAFNGRITLDDCAVFKGGINTAPTTSITSPSNSSSHTTGSNLTITANASDSDGIITRVEFYRAGSTVIATNVAAPYSVVWQNITAGSHALTVKAYDDYGAMTQSSTVNITVSP